MRPRPAPCSSDRAPGQNFETLGSEIHWGDKLVRLKEEDSTLRIGFLNVGGFPTSRLSSKMRHFKQLVGKHAFEVVGMAELNANWDKLPPHSRPHETLFGWLDHSPRITLSYFRDTPAPGAHVFGGTGMISLRSAKDRSREVGRDPRGLGRWVWTRYQGKGSVSLRIVSAYRPNFSPLAPRSVWSQHRTFLVEQNIDKDPREVFLQDLFCEIDKWRHSGDHLVIGVDLNADIGGSKMFDLFRQHGMVDILSNRHGRAPATCIRGSHQIDGLFVTPALANCKCGMLPFGAFDHRPLWLDIPHTLAFGAHIDLSATPNCRRLRIDDPRTVTRFHSLLRQLLADGNIPERLAMLEASSSPHTPLTSSQAQEYEDLKARHLAASLEAERKCRKLRTGVYPFSPTYSRLRYKILYWQLVLRLAQNQRCSRRLVRRTATKAGLLVNTSDWSDPDKARTNLSSARSLLRKFCAADQATAARDDYIHRLAQAKAAHGLFEAEHYLTQLRKREHARQQGRIIRRINKKLRTGSVSLVIGPRFDHLGNALLHEEWVDYTTKADIERACLWENERRFRQASSTPPMSFPLYGALGDTATTPFAADVLGGSFQPPEGTDKWASKLLRELQFAPAVANGARIDIDIDLSKWRKAWRRARETTSGGPSGYTFAHYKANCLPGAEDLADIDRAFVSIPYKTGYSPSLWQQGINCMLEKKKGNFRVDKLRAILVYEAEFNMANKILGRDAMFFAEDLQAVAWEQYGCRKEHSAVNQSLNKTLTCDLCRQKKQSFAICSNDAKSCFDRVVHNIASLSLQRVGVPHSPLICVFTTIRNLEHRIRTVYGDSDIGFCGRLWSVPIQGIGQGNGAGPQIWALVSTPVLNMLRREGYGAVFESAISRERVSFVGYSFVDDTDLVTTEGLLAGHRSVGHKMQGALDAWEGGIRATGGAIVPEKSFWYLVDFKWKHGKWQYMTTAESPASLSVLDLSGERQTLRRLEHHEAERTLGVYVAPDGNMHTQFKILRDKALSWAELARTGMIPRHLAWASYQTTILRSLVYPLASTTLTKQQCRAIMAPVKTATLQGIGVLRSLPLPIAYGPVSSFGMNIEDLYVHQGLEHLTRLVTFYTCPNDITGALLRTSYEQLSLEIGMPDPFSLPYTQWHQCAVRSWLRHTWKFVDEYNIQCRVPSTKMSLRRTGDSFLMQLLPLDVPLKDLLAFNRCRLYKKCLTLSDVCGDSVSPHPHALDQSIRGDHWTARKYEWPNQGCPSPTDWVIWIRYLRRVVKNFGLQLGNWLSSQCSPSFWFSPSSDRLFHCSDQGVVCFPRAPGRPTRMAPRRFDSRNKLRFPLPSDALPAQVWTNGVYYRLLSFAAVLRPPAAHVPQAWDLNAFHADARWAIQNMRLSGLDRLCSLIRQGAELVGVSDGSYKFERGAAAWTIRAPGSPESTISGCCNCPGSTTDHSAYRAELSGLYGLFVAVRRLQQLTDSAVNIQLSCDGLSALNQVFHSSLRIGPNRDHFDLIAACRRIRSELRTQPSFCHVKGHADSRADDTPLTELEEMNVWCDATAKAYLNMLVTRQTPSPRAIWQEPCAVYINNMKV